MMTDNLPKSKLKRKKFCAEEELPEVPTKSTSKKRHTTAETKRSVAPGAVWWAREQLPDGENLWALTLRSALPYLDNRHWDPVPELPHPSTARPTSQQSDDLRWCDLCEEVAAFPEPPPPSSELQPSPDPLGLDSSEQTKPGPDASGGLLNSRLGARHDSKMMLNKALNESLPPLHSWQGTPAGPSGVAGEVEDKEEEEKRETAPANRQVKVLDSRTPQQMGSENKTEAMEDRKRSVREDGGVAGVELQSCPMCLLVFPAGSTQMERDSHLAQCLSDMNVDMNW